MPVQTREELAVSLAKDSRFKSLAPERRKAVFEAAAARLEQAQEQSVSESNTASFGLPQLPPDIAQMLVRGGKAIGAGTELMSRVPGPAPTGNVPRRMAQTVSNIPEGAVVPTMATLGGLTIGSLPVPFSMSAGTGLGAAAGEAELGRRQMARGEIPTDIAQKALSTGLTTAGATAATSGALRAVPATARFLGGNKKSIELATKSLRRAAHEAVKSIRRGGKLNQKVMETVSRESDAAWAPMEEVTKAIPGEIPIAELQAASQAKYAADPAKAEALEFLWNSLAEESKALTAPELANLSSGLSKMMKRLALKGEAARSFTDEIQAAGKSVIADVLELRAPEALKGNVALAKQQWARYATDREALFRFFKVGAQQNADTTRGANLIMRAAQDKASPYEQELLGRFTASSGIQLPKEVMRAAKQLRRAQTVGEVGKATRSSFPYVLYPTLAALGIRQVAGGGFE